MSRKKELKTSIKEEIQKMLGEDAEPSEGRMKLLKLGITYLAVENKLEESEYGQFFGDTDAGQSTAAPKGKKSRVSSDEGGTVTLGVLGDEGEIPS